jgi:hypothetical protein
VCEEDAHPVQSSIPGRGGAQTAYPSSGHKRRAVFVVVDATWANRTDEELLGAIKDEPAAFSAFYRRRVDDVLGFLARRCGDPEQAADLTAEVFATVPLQARRYRDGETESATVRNNVVVVHTTQGAPAAIHARMDLLDANGRNVRPAR